MAEGELKSWSGGERERQQELIIFSTGHKERKRSKQRQKGNYANAN